MGRGQDWIEMEAVEVETRADFPSKKWTGWLHV
jgi:hypothetical protein